MAHAVRVAPSLLSADFAALGEEIRSVERGGCDLLHLDVMDGRFVPNISFGPLVVAAARRISSLPLDVHLMIEEPVRYVSAFADAGADGITVHVEACRDVAETLRAVRERGCRPGITLRPGTPFAEIEPFLPAVDLVLVMTVEPGFGGQSYRKEQEAKLRRAREIRDQEGLQYDIEVDGGIGPETAPSAVEAGAEILVTGSSLFGTRDPADRAAMIRSLQALRVVRAAG
ncbi:MAG: ribulose-phosphate 3-epimerase [Candidatus Eiseniibacteriota bacterium]